MCASLACTGEPKEDSMLTVKEEFEIPSFHVSMLACAILTFEHIAAGFVKLRRAVRHVCFSSLDVGFQHTQQVCASLSSDVQ
jgi:hypothetical protein